MVPASTSTALRDQVRRFYDEYHRSRMRSPDTYWLERIWHHFGGRVLEVGAGRLLWPGAQDNSYVVVDLSAEALRRANATGVPGLLADGAWLPMAGRSFDVVACHDVLEHVAEPERFLAELARVASKRVVVAGPNYVGPHDYTPGLDRHLPRRAINFLLGKGRGCHHLEHAHLRFDKAWYPDADAITAANSWWVARTLFRQGLRRISVETWSRELWPFNYVPLLRHLGPFMLVVAERE